jgi:NhaA family Na+:H+ antiporter
VALGVSVGLLVGKPIGIVGSTCLGMRLNLGELPQNTIFRHVVGLGFLAGIGFTVSLFITELAFRGSEVGIALTNEAKIGIFIGSGLAGVIGFFLLRAIKSPRETYEEAREQMDEAAA